MSLIKGPLTHSSNNRKVKIAFISGKKFKRLRGYGPGQLHLPRDKQEG